MEYEFKQSEEVIKSCEALHKDEVGLTYAWVQSVAKEILGPDWRGTLKPILRSNVAFRAKVEHASGASVRLLEVSFGEGRFTYSVCGSAKLSIDQKEMSWSSFLQELARDSTRLNHVLRKLAAMPKVEKP